MKYLKKEDKKKHDEKSQQQQQKVKTTSTKPKWKHFCPIGMGLTSPNKFKEIGFYVIVHSNGTMFLLK